MRLISWLFRHSEAEQMRRRAVVTWMRQQMELHPRLRDEQEAGIEACLKSQPEPAVRPWLRLDLHRRFLSRVWSPDA